MNKNLTKALIAVGSLVSVFFLVYASNAAQCHSRWIQSEYGFLTGCMVKTDDGMIPEANIRKIYWIEDNSDAE